MLNKFGLKLKLLLFIGCVVMLSISIITSVSFYKSKDALSDLTIKQLESSGNSIKESLNSFMVRSKKFTEILSKDRLVEGLFIAYESSFYGSSFKVGKDIQIANEYYKKLDLKYADRKVAFLTDYEFKDVLLVNLNGQIIFTANNNLGDMYLGRNLDNGVYKDTPLHKCYTEIKNEKNDNLVFSGFFVNDTSNKVAGFLCAKKKAEFTNEDEGIYAGDVIGFVITEVDGDKITKMLTSRTGMGKTGQSYLVGDDYLLRSDFFVNAEKFNSINSMKNNVKVDSSFVKKGIEGKTGVETSQNVNNNIVTAFYQPFEFIGA